MPPETGAYDLGALVLVEPPFHLSIGTCGRGRKDFDREQQRPDLTPPEYSPLVGRNGQDKEIGLDQHVSLEGDVGRRGQDLRPRLVLEIIRKANQQSSDSPLMSRGWGGRH